VKVRISVGRSSKSDTRIFFYQKENIFSLSSLTDESLSANMLNKQQVFDVLLVNSSSLDDNSRAGRLLLPASQLNGKYSNPTTDFIDCTSCSSYLKLENSMKIANNEASDSAQQPVGQGLRHRKIKFTSWNVDNWAELYSSSFERMYIQTYLTHYQTKRLIAFFFLLLYFKKFARVFGGRGQRLFLLSL
jgi:hypothetical protein